MAVLWAAEGPHRESGKLAIEFCKIAAVEGAKCLISQHSPTGLHLEFDRKVSRRAHAMVRYKNKAFWLSDEGSTNGTYLRSGDFLVPILPGRQERLNHMDEFIVGDTIVVFREDDPSQEMLNAARGQSATPGICDARTLPRKPLLTNESGTDPDSAFDDISE